MMIQVGKYYLVRSCWRCNVCGHLAFTSKSNHKCGYAPNFLTEVVYGEVKCGNIKKVKALLRPLEDD